MDPSGPFVIQLTTLEEGESRREFEGTQAELGLDPQTTRIQGPVTLRATLYRRGLRVEIQGRLLGHLEMSCDRCLATVAARIDVPIRVFAERRETRDRRPAQEVREDDLGIVYHDGRFVDLTEEVRQEILVHVPWHALCREGCLGLCPRCGADLNTTPCACVSRGPGAPEREPT